MTLLSESAPPVASNSFAYLSDWFRTYVKPILEEHTPDRVAEFQKQLNDLVQLIGRTNEPLSVCFLGQSQIGKSTLINALVAGDKILLPAGGIGPLTAQAIQVHFSTTPFFEVCYQPKKKVTGLIFALERQLERQKIDGGGIQSANADEFDLDPEDRNDLTVLDEASAQSPAMLDRVKQALLLVAGDQNEVRDLDYLCDALRNACGMKNKWHTTLREGDRENVVHLSGILSANGKVPHKASGEKDPDAFMKELRLHAAGALAPMVVKLDLGWPSELLKGGIRLVDLPGVGIADDAHRVVTKEWIGERANTICLVVTNSGIDESSAELLRSSGFLNRLLYSVNDPTADPVVLCVVVVKMDDLASAKYDLDKQSSPHKFRKRYEHLSEASAQMPRMIRSQLHDQLIRLANEADGEAQKSLIGAGERIVSSLQVFPLSAREYRKFLVGDDDDRAFISCEDDSGVPQFGEAISKLAEELRRNGKERLDLQANNFHDRIVTLLESIRIQWIQDTNEAEAERIRGLLQPFLEPKKRELAALQGKFHEFLHATVLAMIDALVADAATSAERAMRRYMKELKDANWSTLKAVVVRGGAFYGRRPIDLPRDLSLTFEEHVAPIWSRKVIGEVRNKTKQMADDYVVMIEKVVEWAQENGARNQSKVVEALADHIREDGKRMVQVGKDGADELRDQVKRNLLKGIEGPIRARCKRFADSEQSRGRGVKLRMLDLFESEILPIVIDAAKPPASRILKQNFLTVRDEIVECFRQYPDPLKSAEEQIVGRHLDAEKRSKSQRRGRVLASLETSLRLANPGSEHQEILESEVGLG